MMNYAEVPYPLPLTQLRIYPLILTYQVQKPLELPDHAGSMLNGAFKSALYALEEAGQLHSYEGKPLSWYMFDNKTPETHPWYKDFEFAPRGYWISTASNIQSSYHPGDLISFRLCLCGRYIDFLNDLIGVFLEIGKSGHVFKNGGLSLYTISSLSPEANNVIWNVAEPVLSGEIKGTGIGDFKGLVLSGSRLDIHFTSPTALNKSQNVFGGFPFMDLAENLIVRLTMLSNLYCGSEFEWDERYSKHNIHGVHVEESMLQWTEYPRWSSRQREYVPVKGYVGMVKYKGSYSVMSAYLPILMLGQYTHIGRNIAFGAGKYTVGHECYAVV